MVFAVAEQVLVICTQCGVEFSYEQVTCPRHVCDTCKKANHAGNQAVYAATLKGKAIIEAFIDSPERKVVKAVYQGSSKGKATKAAWYNTPRGIASRARGKARRRGRSTDPGLYALRVELLHILKESCAICGESYKRSHQIDHIRALCNGGIDEWSNYQPTCIKCHDAKSVEDRRLHRKHLIIVSLLQKAGGPK